MKLDRLLKWSREYVHQRRPGASIHWPGGLHLEDVKTLKAPWSGNALNPAGRLVAKARLDGQPVKLYEVASAEHARFLEAMMNSEAMRDWFPPVRATRGRFILADWVQGTPIAEVVARRGAETVMERLAEHQAALHAQPMPDSGLPGFNYWKDELFPLLRRGLEVLAEDALLRTVTELVDHAWAREPVCLMQPDLRPGNIIETDDGRWVLVDNELMCVGGIRLFDVCKTAHDLGAKHAQRYLELYLSKSGFAPTPEAHAATQAMWLARLVGAACRGGRFGEAARWIERYHAGENLLPFTLPITNAAASAAATD